MVDSQFSFEGAVLEGGEERVQLRQRRAVRRFQALHRRHPPGEFALQLDGGKKCFNALDVRLIETRLIHGAFASGAKVSANHFMLEQMEKPNWFNGIQLWAQAEQVDAMNQQSGFTRIECCLADVFDAVDVAEKNVAGLQPEVFKE